MARNIQRVITTAAAVLGLALGGCGITPPGTAGTPTGSATGPASLPDGGALYAANCAGCHGPLATSTKIGATLSLIQTAIGSNIGGMASLSALTPDQLQAIANALSPGAVVTAAQVQTMAATLTPVQVQTLTAALAAAPSPTGDVTVDAAQLQTLVSSLTGAQMQAVAATLTPDQIQAVTAALSLPAALPAGSGTGSVVVAASQVRAITSSLLSVGPSTLTVTPAQIQAIAAALTPDQVQALASSLQAATPDGAALYAANCAGCHGPLATSAKAGATASIIQTGISANIGGMGAIATLPPAQVEAIATALGAP